MPSVHRRESARAVATGLSISTPRQRAWRVSTHQGGAESAEKLNDSGDEIQRAQREGEGDQLRELAVAVKVNVAKSIELNGRVEGIHEMAVVYGYVRPYR